MEIGRKIKELRERKSFTMKQLSKLVGCTPSFISQVEKGKADPSISTLKKIANSLDVSMVDFFSPPSVEEDIVTRADQRVDLKLPHWDAHIQSIIRSTGKKKMQAFFTVIKPGGGSHGLFSHEGEELGIILEGELELTLEGSAYVIRENETVYFSSDILHGWTNRKGKDAKVIWVITPPTF
jgi:transcriptional regulator with XRE-family HTH domain